MKTTHVLIAATFAFLCNSKAFSNPEREASNYVVIGAFAIEEHAQQFVEGARRLNLNPVSEINPNRHLYYVYVVQTADREAAFREAHRIRKATPYSDTWVYTGQLGEMKNPSSQAVSVEQEKAAASEPSSTQKIDEVSVVRDTTSSTMSSPGTTSVTVVDKKAEVVPAPEGSKNFFFRIVAAANQQELTGDVDVIDVEKTRRVASYAGNQNVIVQQVNASGKISIVCEVFGYRKVQRDLNFNQLDGSPGVEVDGNLTQVSFELSRLQKGDHAIMYNVYFYKDAAIMRPESRYEVNSLLEMMKENPKYRIRVHGHTNGGAPGKIISMGESKNFFSLTDTREGFGSAKKLSESRAEVIRDYLVAEGISASRMEIKAWGGKRPLHDKHSAQAAANVRVEIEILEDK